jgi:hypothetical protein
MTKYPFVVTVLRQGGTRSPAWQQYNFDDIGVAHMEMGKLLNDRSVYRVQLAVVLKETTVWARTQKPGQ